MGQMTYLSVSVVAVVSLGALAWARSRNGEYCSPFSVVVAAWGLTFGLFLLRLLPYRPISWRAGAIMSLGVAALLAGTLLARRLDRQPRPHIWTTKGASLWVAAYALLALSGTAWYLRLVHQRLGWQAILHDAPRVRYALLTYEIPSRFLFLQFFCMAAPLVAMALVIAGQRLRGWVWGLVAAAWAGTFVTTDRTQFFIVLLTTTFMWLYRRGPSLALRRLAAYVGLAGVVLAANFLIVGYWVGKSAEVVGTAPWVPRAGQLVGGREQQASPRLLPRFVGYASTIYVYATGSFPAFAAYVEEEHPRTYGVQALYPVARLLQRVGLVKGGVPYAIPNSSLVVNDGKHPIGFNAYTFLYYPYQDFGATGVAVYCLLIGLLAGAAYQRTRLVRTSPLHLLVLGQISMALALSVFVNKFNNTAAWYVFVLTVIPFTLPRLRSIVAGRRRPVSP